MYFVRHSLLIAWFKMLLRVCWLIICFLLVLFFVFWRLQIYIFYQLCENVRLDFTVTRSSRSSYAILFILSFASFTWVLLVFIRSISRNIVLNILHPLLVSMRTRVQLRTNAVTTTCSFLWFFYFSKFMVQSQKCAQHTDFFYSRVLHWFRRF